MTLPVTDEQWMDAGRASMIEPLSSASAPVLRILLMLYWYPTFGWYLTFCWYPFFCLYSTFCWYADIQFWADWADTYMLLRSALYCADVQLLVCCFFCLTHQFGIKIMWNRGVWYADRWYRRKSRVVSKSKFKFISQCSDILIFKLYHHNELLFFQIPTDAILTRRAKSDMSLVLGNHIGYHSSFPNSQTNNDMLSFSHRFPHFFPQENVHCVWHQICS